MNIKTVTLHESIRGPGGKEMRDNWVTGPGPRGVDIEVDKKLFPAGVCIKPGADNKDTDVILIPWNNIKCAIYDVPLVETAAGKAKRETEAEA